MLEDGDMIYIPRKPAAVAVIGEVNQNANILYQQDLSLQNYIDRSGGFTRNSDPKNVFLVKTDGTATRNTNKIDAGDTIFVPFLAKERVGKVVRDIVQMIYQVSLSIAAF